MSLPLLRATVDRADSPADERSASVESLGLFKVAQLATLHRVMHLQTTLHLQLINCNPHCRFSCCVVFFQVIAEFIFRFLTHELLMVVMPQIIVQWFAVCCISAMLCSVNQHRSFIANSCLLVMMTPIHFVYIALIVLSVVPNQVTSATCAN